MAQQLRIPTMPDAEAQKPLYLSRPRNGYVWGELYFDHSSLGPWSGCFSCFLFQRLKGAFSPHFPTNFDPLNGYLWRFTHTCMAVRKLIYTANSRGAQEKEDADYDRSVWQAAEYPIQVLIVVWAITHFVRSLATFFHMEQLMEHDVIIKLRAIGLFAVVTWFFFRWKQLFVDDLILQHKMDRARIMGVDKVVSLVLYFLAASCIAEVMGIALHSLLAVGGISGLAVGLAAREVASNFFGGLVLLITRPFVIGDSIKAGSFSGSVQDIGFMQTKVLSDGIPILVPNQAFTNQIITNYSRAKTKVLEATFQLPAGDVVAVNSITERVSKYLQSHPQVENERATPLCYLNNLSHLGPQVQLYCAIKSSGGVVYFRMKQQILLQVGQIIDDALGKDDSWPSLSPLLWELRMLLLYSPAISGSGDHTIL